MLAGADRLSWFQFGNTVRTVYGQELETSSWKFVEVRFGPARWSTEQNQQATSLRVRPVSPSKTLVCDMPIYRSLDVHGVCDHGSSSLHSRSVPGEMPSILVARSAKLRTGPSSLKAGWVWRTAPERHPWMWLLRVLI